METAHEREEAPARILLEALSRGLPPGRMVVDPGALAAISHDDAEWAPAGLAAAAIRARSEAEVQHVVRTCAELGATIAHAGAVQSPVSMASGSSSGTACAVN